MNLYKIKYIVYLMKNIRLKLFFIKMQITAKQPLRNHICIRKGYRSIIRLYKNLYFSLTSIIRMTLAGFPATIVFFGTSLVTIEPAPIIALSPIVIPGKIVEFEPIHTLLPIFTGAGIRLARFSGCMLWFSVAITTL